MREQQQQQQRWEEKNEKGDNEKTDKMDKSGKVAEEGQRPGQAGASGSGTGSGSGSLSPFELLGSDPLVDRAVFDRVNDMLQEVHTLRHGFVPSSSSTQNNKNNNNNIINDNNMASSILSSAPLSARLLAQSLSLTTTSALAAHVTAQVTPLTNTHRYIPFHNIYHHSHRTSLLPYASHRSSLLPISLSWFSYNEKNSVQGSCIVGLGTCKNW